MLVCLGTVPISESAQAVSCPTGQSLVKIGSATNIKAEHFSWYKTEASSLISSKKIKVVEAEIYNASDKHSLGFFRLDITLEDGTMIPLNPSYSKISIAPLQTRKVTFRAPNSVFQDGKRGGLKGQLFTCFTQPLESVEPPKIQLGPPVDPSKTQRETEIYENCIIDLMPDGAKVEATKKHAIRSKCRRISENPSLIDQLKY